LTSALSAHSSGVDKVAWRGIKLLIISSEETLKDASNIFEDRKVRVWAWIQIYRSILRYFYF